jgi:hypothetical protein
MVMNGKLKIFIISLISGLSSFALLYLLFRFLFDRIGCDCGVTSSYPGLPSVPIACGCAAQLAFERFYLPFVYAIPVLIFVAVMVLMLRKLKIKASS